MDASPTAAEMQEVFAAAQTALPEGCRWAPYLAPFWLRELSPSAYGHITDPEHDPQRDRCRQLLAAAGIDPSSDEAVNLDVAIYLLFLLDGTSRRCVIS